MARRTYLNMLKAIPELHERRESIEKGGERDGVERGYRERMERWFGERWGCAPATVRAFTAKAPVRFPLLTEHPQFFEDLREFGALEFTKKGTIKPASRGAGPDIREFMEEAKRLRRERLVA